jgi:hypothetical protein
MSGMAKDICGNYEAYKAVMASRKSTSEQVFYKHFITVTSAFSLKTGSQAVTPLSPDSLQSKYFGDLQAFKCKQQAN